MTRHLKTMLVKETLTSTTVQSKAYGSVGISVEVPGMLNILTWMIRSFFDPTGSLYYINGVS